MGHNAASHGSILLLAAGLLAAATDARAYTNQCAAHDSGGGAVSGVLYRASSSIGSLAGAPFAGTAAVRGRTGFLHMWTASATDTDRDGIVDEDDNDDDGDTLADASEIAGTSFVPPTSTLPLRRDTDGDGSDDGAEQAAGTDPLDATALLRLVRIAPVAGGQVELRWIAREGRQYDVIRSAAVAGLATNGPAAVVTAGAGTGSWKVVEAAVTNAAASSNAFWNIKVNP